MKSKTLLLLFCTLIVLVILLTLDRVGLFDPATPDPDANRIFPTLTASDVRTVTLGGEENGFSLVRIGEDGWQLVQKDLATKQANPKAVDSLVKTLCELRFVRQFDPSDSKNGISDLLTGLNPPASSVVLTDAQGTSHRLLCGVQTPTLGEQKAQTYVRPDGQSDTFVVPGNLTSMLKRPVDAYRERLVFTDPLDAVNQIVIDGKESYTLSKTPDGQWHLTEPTQLKAQQKVVAGLLREIAFLRKTQFLSDGQAAPSDFGLDKPRLRLTLSSPQGQPVTLRLGEGRGDLICASIEGDPSVFAIRRAAGRRVQPRRSTIEDRAVLPFNPNDVTAVSVKQAGQTLLLKRNEKQWTIAAPFATAGNADNIHAALNTLAQAQAKRWFPTTGVGAMTLGTPHATISLTIAGATKSDPPKSITLHVGGLSPDEFDAFCQVPGQPQIAEVSSSELAPLLETPAFFTSQTLHKEPYEQVTKLAIRSGDTTSSFARVDEKWSAKDGDGLGLNTIEFEAMVRSLCNLQVLDVVHAGDSLPDTYSLAKDQIRVTLARAAPTDGKAATPATQIYFAIVDAQLYAWLDIAVPIVVGEVKDDLSRAILILTGNPTQ